MLPLNIPAFLRVASCEHNTSLYRDKKIIPEIKGRDIEAGVKQKLGYGADDWVIVGATERRVGMRDNGASIATGIGSST